jgi:hypothetical protein
MMLSATSRSDETTTIGRPAGSARTSCLITSSAITPAGLNLTRTPRGGVSWTGPDNSAPSNTTVTSTRR